MSDLILPLTRQLLSPLVVALTNARRGGKAPIPAPTTASFTAAQFAAGFTGSVSSTKNAARIYGRANLTLWCGVITGTEAKLTASSDFGSPAWPGLIQVSVDGGAFVAAPNVGTLFTLFAGLAHGPHFVALRFGPSVGASAYIASSGNVLQVTGQPPAIDPVTGWLQPAAPSTNGGTVANAAEYWPLLVAARGNTYGSNVASAKLRGAFKRLTVVVSSNPNKVGVSKNGGAPSFFEVATETNSPSRAITIPCDGSESTYYIWNGGTSTSGGGHFSVAGDAPLIDVGSAKRLDQYGDSITYGTGPGATPVDVETMRVAAALGMVGSTNGIGGYTIAQCKALLDVVLPTKTVTSNDVAILAIGRNNVGAIGSTAQADYSLCIDKLVAKGYGKILCRGILPNPSGSSTWVAENAALQAVVDAKANPAVIWVPTITWTGYGSTDATHPTSAGYATLASFAIPAYSAALGL